MTIRRIERIVLIAGLPGSGKTALARRMAEADPGVLVLDDPRTPEDLHAALEEHPKTLVVCDPLLCRHGALERAEEVLRKSAPTARIERISFENDPKACLANVARRADGRAVASLVGSLSAEYEPAGDVRPVFHAPVAKR